MTNSIYLWDNFSRGISGFAVLPKAIGALSVYAINSLEPPLVLDFIEDYYRTGGSASTFDDALNFSRAGNATMVDSDGVLKWAPHNLLVQSASITVADGWSTTNLNGYVDNGDGTYTITGDDDVFNGAFLHRYGGIPTITGATGTLEVEARPSTTNNIGFDTFGTALRTNTMIDMTDGTVISAYGDAAGLPVTSTAMGDGWYLISVSGVTLDDGRFRVTVGDGAIDVRNPHLYRSDLGGMVDNPATGNSYVPTTDSARYLPRVGNHVYNGDEWVNKGLLLESEARTQLLHTTNALVTQSKTVTAVPHTLHFTGTGTVTLSGASTSGPLVGTGTGEENRVSLTFTPTAASLTLTVSGTVTDAQLEVGSTPSSYIPNLAASGEVTRAAETLDVAAADMPAYTTAVSIQMDGAMTYSDNDLGAEIKFVDWVNGGEYIQQQLATNGSNIGRMFFWQRDGTTADSVSGAAYSPGQNVPFNIASRHGSTFINGAVDGTSLTTNTTPTALPDLSTTDFDIAPTFMGNIGKLRVWAEDLGDVGIAEASA